MRKKIFMMLIVFLCVFSFHSNCTAAAEDIIENDESGIPDRGLYQNILKNLNKGEQDKFTKQEAESIKIMSIQNSPKSYRVKSFKGIGLLKNLKELTAINQKLNSGHLEEIARELPQMEALSLSNNEIESLKPLKNMKNLEYLWVPNNRLTSLEGIEEMLNLSDLEAYNNQLTNVKPVKNLTKLTGLYLSDNQLTDVREIKYLTNLIYLELNSNDLKKLPNLKNLKRLYISDFTNNYLSEKELKNKLPKKLMKNKAWAKNQITLQKSNFKIVITAPKRISKITKNTTKIAGRIETKINVNNISVHMKLLDSGKYIKAKIDKSGKFIFEDLNLKKLKGSQAEIYVFYFEPSSEEGGVVNSVIFTVK